MGLHGVIVIMPHGQGLGGAKWSGVVWMEHASDSKRMEIRPKRELA